jgi:hypothetical protein
VWGVSCIQFQIQFENVDSRFSEKSKLSSLRVFRYEQAQLLDAHTARARDAWNLEFSRRGRDVRVQSGARSGDKIYGDWRVRVLRMEFLYVTFHAIQELAIGWAKVRGATAR